jgi:hypothetical protein
MFHFIASLTVKLQVLEPLHTWTRPITELQRIIDIALRPSKKKSKAIKPAPYRTEIALPDNPSTKAIGARNDIHTMWRIFKNTTTGKLLSILTYAELLGLSVSWFSKHNVDLPETGLRLGEIFREYVQHNSFFVFLPLMCM